MKKYIHRQSLWMYFFAADRSQSCDRFFAIGL